MPNGDYFPLMWTFDRFRVCHDFFFTYRQIIWKAGLLTKGWSQIRVQDVLPFKFKNTSPVCSAALCVFSFSFFVFLPSVFCSRIAALNSVAMRLSCFAPNLISFPFKYCLTYSILYFCISQSLTHLPCYLKQTKKTFICHTDQLQRCWCLPQGN